MPVIVMITSKMDLDEILRGMIFSIVTILKRLSPVMENRDSWVAIVPGAKICRGF